MTQVTAKALLDQLRQLDESDRIEAKRASAIGESLLETVCAFANEPGLGEDEQRTLIFVRETGRITNSDYRDLNRVDTLATSQRLTYLRDLSLIDQVPYGAATYYVPGKELSGLSNGEEHDLFSGLSQEFEALSQESGTLPQESGGGASEQTNREHLLTELPDALRSELERLGQRSRDPNQIPRLIQALCALRPYKARELAILLKRRQDYLHRQHIAPLLAENLVRYQFPDEPNRPDQAYIATKEQK